MTFPMPMVPPVAGYSPVSVDTINGNGHSNYLSYVAGTETNRDKWTVAFWFKRSSSSIEERPMGYLTGSSQYYSATIIQSGGEFSYYWRNNEGTTRDLVGTEVVCNDTNWHHACITYDSTEASAADRLKVRIDGVELTTFSADDRSTIALNEDGSGLWNGTMLFCRSNNSNFPFSGDVADLHLVDGTANDHTAFTQVSGGFLQPKTDFSAITYGNSGCHLDFDDSADLGNDVSGNLNDWTTTGTLPHTASVEISVAV